jgi:tetratricopeptide (TPR) repeat protein
MTLLYRHRLPFGPILLITAGLLAGCASMSAGRRETARAQPLQRVNVAQPPRDHDALALELAGEFALNRGELEVAANHFAAATQVSDDPDIAAQATRVAIAAKQWKQAHAGLERWEHLRSDDPGLWQARAVLAVHDEKPDAAYADLLRLAQQPEAKGWRAISQALLDAGDKKMAAGLLERLATPELLGPKSETWVIASQLADRLEAKALAQTLAQRALEKFHSADTYAWAAQLKVKSGDKSGARTLFADALKRNNKDARLRVAYAALLGELGDNAEAARVLAQGKQDDYTYAARAAYAARANDKKLLEPLYRELKALKPPHPGPRLNLLGELAELLERKSEAQAWYAQVPDDDDHWFDAQLRSALLLDANGKTAEALDAVHRLQARAGDATKELGDAYMLEAEILTKHERGDDGVAVYDRGLKALPDDARLLYARALLNGDLDHVDASVKDLRRVLELKPNDADAMNALGYTLADRTDKKDEALALIENALKIKPDEPAIIDSLGWAQYRLGRLDDAVKQLRTAYSKQPDAEIAAHLGEVLWVSGQKDEAKKVWEQGRKKDAKNKVLLETIKRLSS